MIEFGKTLKAAREAKGYSVAAIAESTHMMSRIIEDLENEDFSKFPAPIYGRGFVKLYCEAVGLDPKPFVAEFMDIYSGNREPTIRERNPVAAVPQPAAPEPAPEPEPVPEPAPEPEPEPAPEPAPEPEPEASVESEPEVPVESPFPPLPDEKPTEDEIPPELRDLELFNPAAFAPPPAEEPEPAEPPRPTPPPLTPPGSHEPSERPRFTRYAPPLRDPDTVSDWPVPKAMIARFAVLAAGAILVLWAMFAGLRALYRATTGSRPPVEDPETIEVTPQQAPENLSPATGNESAPRAKRTPYRIDPLYID